MKRLIILLAFVSITIGMSAQNYWFQKAVATSLSTADILLLYQSGTSKNFTIGTLAGLVNDTADILRAELPPLWRTDIADTADVLRIEIADASTVDTGWTRSGNYTILKHINDSVGIGTATPTTKLHVNGEIKGTRGLFDNGSYSVLLGLGAGESLTSGVNDIFGGWHSGFAATEGSYNIGFGFQSLLALTLGDYNIGIGPNTFLTLTEGEYNIGIGHATGGVLTTGVKNIFIGPHAGGLVSTSTSNSLHFGYYSGRNATGSYNLFIGPHSGEDYTLSGGLGLGYRSLEDATSATGATVGGYLGFTNLTTGDYNTGWGSQVGRYLTIGSYNTLGGYGSADSLVSGSYNTTWGFGTGQYIIDSSWNTYFGAYAGASTIGSYNVFVGPYTGYVGSISRSVLIGYGAGGNLFSPAGSDELWIENSTGTPLIWGDFDADSLIINGDLRVTEYSGGANAWTNESDRRLKENITPIKNALDKVLNLQGVEFEWKTNPAAGTKIGFIAQDVEKVLPEVVHSGNPYSMETSQITAVLVEAIKEQQKQLNAFKILTILLLLSVVVLFIRSRKYLKS